MTKCLVAIILTIAGIVASSKETKLKVGEMARKARQFPKNFVHMTETKPATASTYVTMQEYSDSACTTVESFTTYGTNMCATLESGSGSVQLLYTTSDDGGVLTEQLYSDNTCTTPSGTAYDVIVVTDVGNCQSGNIYTVSSTFSLPDENGFAEEYFATSSACSANTPIVSFWFAIVTFDDNVLDDGVFDDFYSPVCESTTANTLAGNVNAYLTDVCTGSACSTGNSNSAKSCFAGSETVLLESGEVRAISEVSRGDRVLAADAVGNLKFSTVVAVPHAANKDAARFIHIIVTSGADIKMTEDHLLMVSPACSFSAELMVASSVEEGMCVMTTEAIEKVAHVQTLAGKGVYTIVTEEEMIVVNGFVASPFATNHATAKAFYNIVQMLPVSLWDNYVVQHATEIFGSLFASF